MAYIAIWQYVHITKWLYSNIANCQRTRWLDHSDQLSQRSYVSRSIPQCSEDSEISQLDNQLLTPRLHEKVNYLTVPDNKIPINPIDPTSQIQQVLRQEQKVLLQYAADAQVENWMHQKFSPMDCSSCRAANNLGHFWAISVTLKISSASPHLLKTFPPCSKYSAHRKIKCS